jgi:hypothetical protein
MTTLISALLIAAAIVWSTRLVVSAIRRPDRGDERASRELALVQLFAPAIADAERDPRVVAIWQPIAQSTRARFAEEFAALDRAFAGGFPFSAAQIEAAHATWTADWLGWERAHDAQYKLRAGEMEHQPGVDPAVMRARLESIEREKLDLYQRRYEEYVRVAKALQSLIKK